MKLMGAIGLMCLAMFAAGCNCNCKDMKDMKSDGGHEHASNAGSPKMMCIVEKEHEADPKVTYEYKGKTYHFCCKDCVEEFKKNPDKYASK